MDKRWILRADIGLVRDVETIVQTLLRNRGLLDEAQIAEFLNPTPPGELFPEDFGLPAADLSRAADLVRRAIAAGSPIVIHGDFDVDGISAAAILWQAIYRGLGYKKCLPFIPERFAHGYGLTPASIDGVLELPLVKESDGAPPLLITVDCGVTAATAVAYARERGFEVLVTDHHQPGAERVAATEILWTDKVCGAAIAWLLARELLGNADQFLDLSALATVADIQDLFGVNRALVKFGLAAMQTRLRPGLAVLVEGAGLAGRALGTYELGWILAPRLNASGRLATAIGALRLLCTEDAKQAKELALELEALNQERQGKSAAMLNQALAWVGEGGPVGKITIVSHESYHEGVIGLVAGRLVEAFYRPAVVIAQGPELSKGSARSVSGFNIVAALRELQDVLEDVGGHPMAAGFTLRTENVAVFTERLTALAEAKLGQETLQPVVAVDLEVPLEVLSWELLAALRGFEPTGPGNGRPVFLSRGAVVLDSSAVGKTGQHLRLHLKPSEAGMSLPAVGFGLGSLAPGLRLGDRIDVIYTLEENQWNGQSNLELHLKDLKPSSNP